MGIFQIRGWLWDQIKAKEARAARWGVWRGETTARWTGIGPGKSKIAGYTLWTGGDPSRQGGGSHDIRRYGPVLVALFLFSISLSADEPRNTPVPVDDAACAELAEQGMSGEVLAQRGCCSWHKGVCGCSGGRTKCCDGTLSPSCTCLRDDLEVALLPLKTE